MKRKIYNLLVNRHAGIKERFHKFRKNAFGFKRIIAILYLLWLNFAYYVLFCRFLGQRKDTRAYEQKKLVIKESESGRFIEPEVTVDEFVKKLSEYDTVSFDIFDTLIFRPFSEPVDLFYMIGEQLGIMNFKNIRQKMEKEARQERFSREGHYEITITDIWNRLENEVGISARDGMRIEMELEMDLCYANPFMLQVYNRIKDMGKQIIIISDMYLPKKFLKKLLEKNGYTDFEQLYVSCEKGINKYSGKLFKSVIDNGGIRDRRIHVGDNTQSDVKMAVSNGFESCYYPNVNRNSLRMRAYDMSSIIGGAYRGIVNNRLYNGVRKYGMEYEYGFVYGGLFVTGYCSFIHKYYLQNNVDKILFLSRDGDILKQVYEKMYPDDNIDYAYWSRRASTKLMADYDRFDYFRRFLLHRVNQGITLTYIMRSMQLEELLPFMSEKFNLSQTLTEGNVYQVKAFLEDNWDKVLTIYEKEQNAAKCYYSELLTGCSKVVAVDIGWAGSGAMALNTLVQKRWNIPCDIIGLVAGTNTMHNVEPDASEAFLLSGKLVPYMFSFAHNRDLTKKHDLNSDYNVYWELLLASPTPQLSGFEPGEDGSGYSFCFGDYDRNREGIRQIQKGILDFAQDYTQAFNKYPYMFNISGRDAYAPMVVAASYNEKYLKEIYKRFNLEINVS